MEILEGVKTRSRIQEQVEGEKVSAYLIGKQNTIKSKKLMTSIKVEDNVHESLNPGTDLKNQDSIEWYVNRYFEKVYEKEEIEDKYQDWFLNFLDEKLTSEDKEELEKEVSEIEIFIAVKVLNSKKSPGIDGIPNDFYYKYWNIIKTEVSDVVRHIIKGLLLQGKKKERSLP